MKTQTFYAIKSSNGSYLAYDLDYPTTTNLRHCLTYKNLDIALTQLNTLTTTFKEFRAYIPDPKIVKITITEEEI